jgi:hypothetical protein
LHRRLHTHGTFVEVCRAPRKAKQFTHPHAGRQSQNDNGFEPIAFGAAHELACLNGRERSHLRATHARSVREPRHVPCDFTPSLGVSKGAVNHTVHVKDCPRRGTGLPPVFVQSL